MGASAGGVEALRQVVTTLDPVLPAPVLVVLHQPSNYPSVLPGILSRSGPLPAEHPGGGEALRPGRIYVAPPDHHLLLAEGRLVLSRGPREHGHRPAVDPLFRSAAAEFGPGAVGVVLSGNLDDGSAGLVSLVRTGGRAVVQDPEDALYPGMPRAALALAPGALVAKAVDLGAVVSRIVEGLPEGRRTGDEKLSREVAVARFEEREVLDPDPPGQLVGVSCPDCSGPLYKIDEPGVVRYRCRVGHAWSPESMAARQDTSAETALWVALRALEDKAVMHRRIAGSAAEGGAHYVSRASLKQAEEAERSAALVRRLLVGDQEEPAS